MRHAHLLTLAMLCAASPAFAHAFLERASPPVGSAVATSPPELALTFTEGVEPLFSTLELRDANGAPVSIGTPRTASGNDRQLVIDLPKLAPGTYSVIWHATSVDTHKTEGSYKFTVGQ
jgi:methionine-rich copper-binding protein CopC